MKPEQYLDLVERLERIEALLKTKKPGRKPAVVDERTDLTRERVDTLETLFWKIVNAPRAKKADAYRVPQALLGERDEPNIEAVVASVLLNQASLRKVFRTAGLGDSKAETPLDRARRTLAASNLYVVPMSRLRLGAYVETTVAVSPGELARKGRGDFDLPAPVGWTTTSRAEGFEGMEGFVEPPEDPCGARVWPGGSKEDDQEQDVPAPSLKQKSRTWDSAVAKVAEDIAEEMREKLAAPAAKGFRVSFDNGENEEEGDLTEPVRDEAEQEESPKPLRIKVELGSKNK